MYRSTTQTRPSRTASGAASTKRAAIYLRVSSEDQLDGYSVAAQERAITAFCAQHGWEITARYLEPGRSARTDDDRKRPAFHQMMGEAEARAFDVIVVHKLDRFARNRCVAFDAFHRLGTVGVGFVSVAENMDYSTPAGQLMLTMLVGLGQFYSDNLSFETKKGKSERKRQGMYNGLLPFGTTKGPGGVPVLDTSPRYCLIATRTEIVPGDGLILAFELAAASQTDREIARALNDAGYRTSGNRGMNPFTKDSVRVVLRNRFYLGELPDGDGGWLPGKHEALIDSALFERAESSRGTNTCRPRRVAGVRSPWALSSIATCGSCGSNITADGRRRARCAGRIQGNGCEEPSFFIERIERQVGELLGSFAVPQAERTDLLRLWRQYQTPGTDTTAERSRLRKRLERLKDLYLDGDLDKTGYQAERGKVADQLAAMRADGDQSSDVGERLATYLADIGAAWAEATPEERNMLARQLFSKVVITNRTAVAVVPRPDLRPFFAIVAVKYDEKSCYGGSDGDRLREIDAVAPPLVPFLFPERLLRSRSRHGTGRYSLGAKPRSIPQERWPEVVARAKGEGLRSIAREFGVSHETVRKVLRVAVAADQIK